MSFVMRKYRRPIMIATVVFCGVPFAFMGGGFFGNNQSGFAGPESVAQVSDIEIKSDAFLREYYRVLDSLTTDGIGPTAEQLLSDGTVDQILDRLVNDALLTVEINKRGLEADEEYLIEQLKDDSLFRNENGEFDKGYYNTWVETNQKRGTNWSEIYNIVSEQVSRGILLDVLSASARIFQSELKESFSEANTTIKVKYAAIEPKIELTEDELKTYFQENLERYQTAEERVAEFVRLSLEPEEPAIVQELIDRARAGEDFAELAKEYSEAIEKSKGGDIGWLTDAPNLPAHQKPLFSLKVGEVSDAVDGPIGIHIYKIDEERTSGLTSERDVHARQIVIRPKLDVAEREARTEIAAAFAELAKEDGDLAKVAATEDFEVKRSSSFSTRTLDIDNVDAADALLFRRDLSKLALDEVSGVIKGRKNLYVAKIIEVLAPRQKTFEEARDDVAPQAKNDYKRGTDYTDQVKLFVEDIEEKTDSLEAVRELFPELDLEIKETKAFNPSEFLFSDGIYWNTRDAYAAIGEGEIGTFVGPITDFQDTHYFLELVERNAPDEKAWEEKFPAAKVVMSENALAALQFERQSDYLLYLTERAEQEALIQVKYPSILALLNVGTSDDDATTDEETTAVPVVEAPPITVEVGSDIGSDESASE